MSGDLVIRLPELWPHQQRFVDDPARYTVCKSATKTGKTMACAWWLAREIVRHPDALFWWVGPTADVGLIGYKTVCALLEPMVERKTERPHKCWFENGSVLILKSAQEPEYLRGAGIKAMVLDEAGCPQFDKAWPEIHTTMRATRGRLKIIGNPGDGGGFLDRAEAWGVDPEIPAWSFHFFEYLDRPTAKKSDLEEARRELGEDSLEFRRYYLGETIRGEGGFFYNVDKVAVAEPEEPQADRMYVIGVDSAIKTDYYVGTVWDEQDRRQVAISRYKGPPAEHQAAETQRLAKHYNNAAVLIETNGAGGPIYQELVKLGVDVRPFETTGKSKPEILHEYRSDIAYARVTLLDEQIQTREHLQYQHWRTPAGNSKFGAPHGGHDDTVMANAIATYGLRRIVDAEPVWVC